MNISPEGLAIIKKSEGLRLSPYLCPAGVPTIGYGHTKGVTMKSPPITASDAERLLREDSAWAENAVAKRVKISINQNQFDALVSFVFNIGEPNFATSTLLRRLNSGDYNGASAEFDRWVYGNGKKLPGLISRRKEERALFNRPATPDPRQP